MARWGFRAAIVAFSVCLLPLAPAHALTLTQPEQAVLELIRDERIPRGLDPLSVKADLVEVARRHSARMAADERIFHNGELGSEVDDWMLMTENVGRGPRIIDIHDAFMASDSHRPHIIDPRMEQVGIGVVEGDDGLFYVTQIFALREKAGSSEPAARTKTVRRSATSGSTSGTVRSPTRIAAVSPLRPVENPPAPVRTLAVLRYLVSLDA